MSMTLDDPLEVQEVDVKVPLFLKKLWKILEEERDGIIEWNSAGDGFVILDQLSFIVELLPKYFKHSNIASFIRQLNMYGFHKIAHIDKDEMHFSHPYFLKGLPQLLSFIKRKPVVKHHNEPNNAHELNEVFDEIKKIKSKHTLVDTELKNLKKENSTLWSELNNLRTRYSKQSQIINKLIHFLITYMHSSPFGKRNRTVVKDSGPSNLKNGPTILELDFHDSPTECWKKYDETAGTKDETDPTDPDLLNEYHVEEPAEAPGSSHEEELANMPTISHITPTPAPSKLKNSPGKSILVDNILNSKENFNMFLDSTQTELNNFADILNNLNASDVSKLLKMYEPPVAQKNLPITETGENSLTDEFIDVNILDELNERNDKCLNSASGSKLDQQINLDNLSTNKNAIAEINDLVNSSDMIELALSDNNQFLSDVKEVVAEGEAPTISTCDADLAQQNLEIDNIMNFLQSDEN